jgi:hypothetical protein
MYSNAGNRQKCRTKHNPQQAANNLTTEAKKKKNTHQFLNYQTWKFTV